MVLVNKKEKFFSVDAKTLLSLGRNSIKDNTTALLELVKNSYDADASRVEIEIFCNSSEKYIRVADNGKGMTEEELDSRWLRIGHSTKGLEKITGSKRRKTGEKGIGRISADRLGAELELKTRSEDNETIGLKTDWNKFDVEGCNLDEIPSTLITNPQIQIPGNGKTGTELIITSLRQQWTADDIAILYEELSVLMPPFKQINNFEIFLNTDVSKEHKGKIISDLELAADTEITATYTDDKVNYVLRNADQIRNDKPGEKEQIDLKKLVHLATSSNLLQGKPSKLRCGPAEVRILFYLRAASGLGESGFSLKKLRDYLNKFAGVKIYRDGIYVKPYGNPADPEGDWLSLAERKTREPAGVSRETYRVGGNQIIGAVLISRDKNPNLVDSAAREGFIKGQAFNDLRILVLGCLRLLESYRHR